MVEQSCVFVIRDGKPVVECPDEATKAEAFESMVAHPDVQASCAVHRGRHGFRS